MKHIKSLSKAPAKAATAITPGQILTVIAQILAILGTALTQKSASA